MIQENTEVRIIHGQPATLEQKVTSGKIRAAVMRAQGRSDVSDTANPSSREIHNWIHRKSSEHPGGLPRKIRRATKAAERKARAHKRG